MSKQLKTIRLLEEKLKDASPAESARLTQKIVKLKEDWLSR